MYLEVCQCWIIVLFSRCYFVIFIVDPRVKPEDDRKEPEDDRKEPKNDKATRMTKQEGKPCIYHDLNILS
ncbi:MAG: hypothetical protein A2V89_01060 [Gammaproteobacteria bacterium RBG_16_37_9]|nr:MAG: hypothetical protein A2V89_01060 [Gammaproteobacteria bacterium RBG_16_37_9]